MAILSKSGFDSFAELYIVWLRFYVGYDSPLSYYHARMRPVYCILVRALGWLKHSRLYHLRSAKVKGIR